MVASKKQCDSCETIGIVPVDQIPKVQPFDMTAPQLYKVFTQMETLCKNFNGIGLHAVQIGKPWDIYIIKNSNKFEYYMNCIYLQITNEKTISCEGCLSLTNKDNTSRHFIVERYKKIKVMGKRLNTEGKLQFVDIDMELSVEKDGIICIAHQHEISHGLGILISDIGKEQHIWM
jgi:peptide deformylase